MTGRPRLWLLLALGCLLALNAGCGMLSGFRGPAPDTAREYYQSGESAMRDRDYGEAIEHFSALKERFPFSEYTARAELRLADAYYEDGRLEAAEDAYKEFETLHPGDRNIPYVLYRIGVCNFKQFRSIDLPMQNLQEALQYFNRVVQSFPDSQFVPDATTYRDRTRRLMAKHELFVADFYWRRGEYQAAWKRYEYVQEQFPDLESIQDYARSQGRLAYYRYQEHKAEQERAAQNGDWTQLFDWL